MREFVLGIVSSLAASALIVAAAWFGSHAVRGWVPRMLARLTGTTPIRAYRTQADANRHLAEDLRKARWIMVLAGRGNELTRDSFAPVWRHPDGYESIRVLLPDPEVNGPHTWLARREAENAKHDKGHAPGRLATQIRGNVEYLVEATKASANVELRLFDLPSVCRIVATDAVAYFTTYKQSDHGRNSPCLVWRNPSPMYEYAVRLCTVAWDGSRAVHPQAVQAPAATPAAAGREETAGRAMVNATLYYASVLASQQKDVALLDLRSGFTRTLHLLGAHEQRVRLGGLALRAAQRLEDTDSVAAILLDDLGWATFAQGQRAAGRALVLEGLQLLETQDPAALTVAARQLLVRGYRHLGAMTDVALLDEAIGHLERARSIARQLPAPLRSAEEANISAVYGDVLATGYAYSFSDDFVFPESSSETSRLVAVMDEVDEAVASFEATGDVERAAKASAVHLRLARHQSSRRVKEASLARLERYQRTAIRQVQGWPQPDPTPDAR